MFIVFLRFSNNKAAAKTLMQDHNTWLQQGMASGMFLLAGSIQANQGGCMLAVGEEGDLQAYIKQDPFVINDVVTAEIVEINPALANDKLQFLIAS